MNPITNVAKSPGTLVACIQCARSVAVHTEWVCPENIKYNKSIPWCPACFSILFKHLPGTPPTRAEYLAAYEKAAPTEIYRADMLEIALGLKPPCNCNLCGGHQ
jgi:hypothetical protein